MNIPLENQLRDIRTAKRVRRGMKDVQIREEVTRGTTPTGVFIVGTQAADGSTQLGFFDQAELSAVKEKGGL